MALLESYQDLIDFKKSQKDLFQYNNGKFTEHINSLFKAFEFELVAYDEVEYFKKYNNPEFNYPYQMRKTKLGTFAFDILIDEETYDYNYYSKIVSFQ